MTEGTDALGVPEHADWVDVVATHAELRSAVIRLGQLTRLQAAEAGRARRAGSPSNGREIADAWTSANELLAAAVGDLERAEARLTDRMPTILDAIALVGEGKTP